MAGWIALLQVLLKLLAALLRRRSTPPAKAPAPSPKPTPSPSKPATKARIVSEIDELFRSQTSDRIVTASGVVVHLLPDDNDTSDGSAEHQQFLVEVDGCDVTVKIAHNLKFGRVPVRKEDTLRFKGEYEYSDRGGCIHWTHHDPKNWREGGWIEHRGKRYE